jgi:Leucine-rich repeat (LRR) protein
LNLKIDFNDNEWVAIEEAVKETNVDGGARQQATYGRKRRDDAEFEDKGMVRFPAEMNCGIATLKFPDYLPAVTSLELRYSRSQSVLNMTTQYFSRMTRLTGLDARSTAFSPESFETIGSLTTLQNLGLDSCQNLASAPVGTFRNLRNLVTIFLQNCSVKSALTAIPSDLYELTTLTSLDIYRNEITAIDAEISRLTNLRFLVLTDNALNGQLHSNIGALTGLEALHLNQNKLESLPPTIGKLTNLISLRLAANPLLTTLPDEMTQLTQLNFLSPSDCANLPAYWRPNPLPNTRARHPTKLCQLNTDSSLFQYLPALTNVTELTLSQPQHLSFHRNIWKLPNLHTVAITFATDLFFSSQDTANELMYDSSGDVIAEVKGEISEIERAERLIYAEKALYWKIPNYRSVFNNISLFFISSLTSLNLSHCSLTQIPPDLYRQCLSLIELNLSNNEITFIDRSVRHGSFFITFSIFIHFSLFLYLDVYLSYSLGNLPCLKKLNLDYNDIGLIPFEMNELLANQLKDFTFRFNPFVLTFLANGVQVQMLHLPLNVWHVVHSSYYLNLP